MPRIEEVEAERRERARAEISNPWWINEGKNRRNEGDKSVMKNYIVQYWRNDGSWHNDHWDPNPTYSFYAKSDDEAMNIALGYISVNKVGNEDFWIDKLAEVKFEKREVVVQDYKPETFGNNKTLERKLKGAKFKELSDAIFK